MYENPWIRQCRPTSAKLYLLMGAYFSSCIFQVCTWISCLNILYTSTYLLHIMHIMQRRHTSGATAYFCIFCAYFVHISAYLCICHLCIYVHILNIYAYLELLLVCTYIACFICIFVHILHVHHCLVLLIATYFIHISAYFNLLIILY